MNMVLQEKLPLGSFFLDAGVDFVYAGLVLPSIPLRKDEDHMATTRVTGKCMSLDLTLGMSAADLAKELRQAADQLEQEPNFRLNEVGATGTVVEFDLISGDVAA